MRSIAFFIVLFAVWLLLSGVYTPMIVGLGFASSLLVVIIIRRMDAQDGDKVTLHLSPVRLPKYIIWLMAEIARANWAVTKVILSRKMNIHQHMFTVPYTQKADLAQVIFANSITLTPGTITVETEEGQFLVHAVSYSDDDPAAIADMDARVTACETARGTEGGA
ncbi:Na+/H+ antiporter subunit E [Profundibacter sp.]